MERTDLGANNTRMATAKLGRGTYLASRRSGSSVRPGAGASCPPCDVSHRPQLRTPLELTRVHAWQAQGAPPASEDEGLEDEDEGLDSPLWVAPGLCSALRATAARCKLLAAVPAPLARTTALALTSALALAFALAEATVVAVVLALALAIVLAAARVGVGVGPTQQLALATNALARFGRRAGAAAAAAAPTRLGLAAAAPGDRLTAAGVHDGAARRLPGMAVHSKPAYRLLAPH